MRQLVMDFGDSQDNKSLEQYNILKERAEEIGLFSDCVKLQALIKLNIRLWCTSSIKENYKFIENLTAFCETMVSLKIARYLISNNVDKKKDSLIDLYNYIYLFAESIIELDKFNQCGIQLTMQKAAQFNDVFIFDDIKELLDKVPKDITKDNYKKILECYNGQ